MYIKPLYQREMPGIPDKGHYVECSLPVVTFNLEPCLWGRSHKPETGETPNLEPG